MITKEHWAKYGGIYQLSIVVGIIAGIIVVGFNVASRPKKVCITPESVQALCIHLKEKYGYDFPMKECKARKPLEAATPWVKDN